MARQYAKSLKEAKQLFKERTGADYDRGVHHHSGVRIHTLKKPTPMRKHYVGTYMEWLNKG